MNLSIVSAIAAFGMKIFDFFIAKRNANLEAQNERLKGQVDRLARDFAALEIEYDANIKLLEKSEAVIKRLTAANARLREAAANSGE